MKDVELQVIVDEETVVVYVLDAPEKGLKTPLELDIRAARSLAMELQAAAIEAETNRGLREAGIVI